MGGAKRMMMERDDLAGVARGVLVQVGALNSCPMHGELFEGNGDVEGAYKLGNYKITQGDIDLGVFDRAEFSAIINEEFEENSAAEMCGYCAKHLDD